MLEVIQVTKRFGGLVAVNDVSFNVAKGEIFGIFGPNGSGKTTLLNTMAGVYPPTSGRIVFNGASIEGQRPHTIADLGLVKTFQNPQLFDELTTLENVLIASHLFTKRRLGFNRVVEAFRWGTTPTEKALNDRAQEILKMCRLTDVSNRLAENLSYGQEKMLGVAMALMCEPSLLLLDEPASGLGDAEIANLEEVLRDLRTNGMTLCIIDHKIGFLGRLADRALALRQGKLLAIGTPKDVLGNAQVIEAYIGRKNAEKV